MNRTPSTTTRSLSRGSVHYVPFVFTDGSRAKNRPAVIVSSDAYHSSRNEVIFAAVTTNVIDRGFVGQVALEDWAMSGLRRPSAVSGIVMTLHISRLGRRVGELTMRDQQAVDRGIRQAFGL